ncbi:MAG: hypothetical protein L0219_15490, partial [Phycisphaerales bacterium]|nr:hypothetical protein [Phycisphaerales bacterium]
MRQSFLRFAAICIGFLNAEARSDDNVKVESFLSGLHQPCGVAVRPGGSADSYDIYVSDTGAGRVVRIKSGQPGSSADAIVGFTPRSNGEEHFELPGPRGLLFLDRARLIVLGGNENEHAFVSLYELSDEEKPLIAEQHEQNIELTASDAP